MDKFNRKERPCYINLEGVEVYRHTGIEKTAEELLMMAEYITGKHCFDTGLEVLAGMRVLRVGN